MKALLFAAAIALPAPAFACEVALALIVDVSGSISAAEYAMQMQGMADAMLDPTVRDALLADRSALAVIQWSGSSRQKVVLPWTEMRSDAILFAFSEATRSAAREWFASQTGIGPALRFTGEYFNQAPDCARRVIDVSGDGPSNDGPPVWAIRDGLVSRGITINGVAIESAVVGVTGFYRDNVIGGNGAFVLTADDFEDYARAIRRKLINEVTRPGS